MGEAMNSPFFCHACVISVFDGDSFVFAFTTQEGWLYSCESINDLITSAASGGAMALP